MLGRQSCSSRLLLEKLREKGYDEAAAAGAVAWCLEQHFLDDEAFARRISGQKAAKGYGARRIREFLRAKLFDAGLIDRVLKEAEESRDTEDAAEKLLALCRRLHRGDVWDGREKARVSAALSRRGFGWDEINAALREVSKHPPPAGCGCFSPQDIPPKPTSTGGPL